MNGYSLLVASRLYADEIVSRPGDNRMHARDPGEVDSAAALRTLVLMFASSITNS